jgi:Mitochondrial domain of unknown function (DUF1713)
MSLLSPCSTVALNRTSGVCVLTSKSTTVLAHFNKGSFSSLFFDKLMKFANTSVVRMSSTLKKRRAKMNKHKLRKRRKLLRRKSK